MSDDVAIRIDRVSKMYRLGGGPMGQGDFREAISHYAGRMKRRFTSGTALDDDYQDERELWALSDVTFDVRRGEVVGLIGHNGAGKSTLLKILSRITDPTSGEAWYEGRVGSLLEVGTGFHPELTGRENIYLNGTILGMTTKEIDAKFDDIVAFSEIGHFLDTPVKRYSSGMYVRLAFSVAAHLEPEILIVDEVLAVGDAAFQRKCMDKMKEVVDAGSTILFVSHNMGSIQALCDRAIVLSAGKTIGEGSPVDMVKLYLQSTAERSGVPLAEREQRRGDGRSRVMHGSVRGSDTDPEGVLIYGQPAQFSFEVSELLPGLRCIIMIYDGVGRRLVRLNSEVAVDEDVVREGKTYTLRMPEVLFAPGKYHIDVRLAIGHETADRVDSAIQFEVEDGVLHGRALTEVSKGGMVVPPHSWVVPKM